MTAYDISQTYESRHVKEFLGINKNQLFHWIKTKKLMRPVMTGEGRGRRTRFSLDDLLTLSLIQAVHGFGIELNIVRKIMATIKDTEHVFHRCNVQMENPPEIKAVVKYESFGGSLWDYYRAHREILKEYGYSLEIRPGFKPDFKLPPLRKTKSRALENMEEPITSKEILQAIAQMQKRKDCIPDIEKRPVLWKPAGFKVRAMDGESQCLLLSAGINPTEKRLYKDSIHVPPSPSSGVIMIVNLLSLIKQIETVTHRVI